MRETLRDARVDRDADDYRRCNAGQCVPKEEDVSDDCLEPRDMRERMWERLRDADEPQP